MLNCDCSDTTGNRTLSQLRVALATRMGYAATASNLPASIKAKFNAFLDDAQRILYKRYKALQTERFYQWNLTANEKFYCLSSDATTPTGVAVANAPTTSTLAAGTYYYRVSAVVDGESLASDEVSVTSAAGDTNTVSWTAVTGATKYRVYGRTQGAERLLGVTALTSFADDGSITPAGQLPTALDPLKLTYVGVNRNGIYTPLTEGIPVSLYSNTGTGWPLRYVIRDCVEVWPVPAATEGQLILRGHFGLLPFTNDGDVTTIDDQLVLLLALANAKADAGKADANLILQEHNEYLGDVIAGTHGTRRYIPGQDQHADSVYVQPQPTEPFT